MAINSDAFRGVLKSLVVCLHSDGKLSESISQLPHRLCFEFRASNGELAAATDNWRPRLNDAASVVGIVVNMNTHVCDVIGRLHRGRCLGKRHDRRCALRANFRSGHAEDKRPNGDSWRNVHGRVQRPNDLKLSDRGVRRGTCTAGGKAAVEAGAVTHGAVRCSAWLNEFATLKRFARRWGFG